MGIGIACMLGVVALWSIVPVLVKLLIPIFDPFTIAFLRLSQGAAVVLAATRFHLHSTPTTGTLAMVFALGVLATGGAFILVSEGMKRLSAALVGTATAVAPIGQIVLAHWVLGEPVSWSLASGGVLILGGVLSIVYAERR